MSLPTGVRDTFITSRYELLDSLRSRRAVIWILFFILSAVVASSVFIFTITKIEEQIAEMIRVSTADKPGHLTTSVWESDLFLNQITPLVGDKDLARSLLKTPPITLFYAWFTLWSTPLLIIIICSESISTDISSGAARFIVFRISRLSWCSGKALGQACLLGVALVLGAVCVWGLGYWGLAHFEPVKTATSLIVVTIKTWLYSLSFLGLALGISQAVRSVNWSRSLGLIFFLIIAILSKVANHYAGDGLSRLWELVYLLTPQAHRMTFWRPELSSLAAGITFTTGLGILYFFAGHLILARKDV
jgi:ABC-type transport system involved in multi-copper enzyme maturation permease subunit